MKKNYRSFLLKHLIYLPLIITIIICFFHPKYLYKNANLFNVTKTVIDDAIQYLLLPDNHNCDLFYAYESEKNFVNFLFRDLKSRNLRQVEIRGLTLQSSFNKRTPEFYYDPTLKKIYVIGTKNRADYYLYEFTESRSSWDLKTHFLFRNEYFDSLCDSLIILNNIKFYSYNTSESIGDSLLISTYKDGYKIIINKSIHENLQRVSTSEIEKNKLYKDVCRILSNKLKSSFHPKNLFELKSFFQRKSYYQDRTFPKTDKSLKGFFRARIIGKIDANRDGAEDIVIMIDDDRWLPVQLLCYDTINKVVLWKKEFSTGSFRNYEIIDIDNDGFKEIILSSYSPMNQHPIDELRRE